MRRLPILVLTAAALLGGCASFGPTEPAFAWTRADTDDAARLVLATPSPTMTMACQRGSGAVEVTLIGRRENGAMVELHAGAVWNRYLGAGATTDGPDAPLAIQARLAATDPVLARFGDTGELTIVQGEARLRTAGSFAPVHDFLALCRA